MLLLSPWLSSFSTCCLHHHSPLGPLSPAGWVSRVSGALVGPLDVGGLDARRVCSLWPSQALLGGAWLSPVGTCQATHWALEQVCLHGPLAPAGNMPSLASGTQRAQGCTFQGSCNKLFPLLWRYLHGVARGQHSEAGNVLQGQPSGARRTGTWNGGPWPIAPGAATGS